jgi:hypothetical protein
VFNLIEASEERGEHVSGSEVITITLTHEVIEDGIPPLATVFGRIVENCTENVENILITRHVRA